MSRGATSRRNAEALTPQPLEASPAQLVLHSILVARCCHVLAHRDVERVVGDARQVLPDGAGSAASPGNGPLAGSTPSRRASWPPAHVDNGTAVQASGHSLLIARASGGTDAGRRRDA